jgi:hypothetical protein
LQSITVSDAVSEPNPVTFTQPQPGANPKRHSHAFAIRVPYSAQPVAFGSFSHRHAASIGHAHHLREPTGPALYPAMHRWGNA